MLRRRLEMNAFDSYNLTPDEFASWREFAAPEIHEAGGGGGAKPRAGSSWRSTLLALPIGLLALSAAAALAMVFVYAAVIVAAAAVFWLAVYFAFTRLAVPALIRIQDRVVLG